MKAYNQVSLGASDTIRSKELYELDAEKMGIAVKRYHRYNWVYKSKEFQEDLVKQKQYISLSRVGAHR